MRKLSSATAALIALTAIALASASALALAAETTRAEYVAAVEPICKANTQADGRILKGVKAKVRSGKLKPAAAQFAKAAAALAKAHHELAAVPQPPADRARLGKWLGFIENEVGLFEGTARKLKAGEKAAAERESTLLIREANRANGQVLSFEFNYCHAEPSQFT